MNIIISVVLFALMYWFSNGFWTRIKTKKVMLSAMSKAVKNEAYSEEIKEAFAKTSKEYEQGGVGVLGRETKIFLAVSIIISGIIYLLLGVPYFYTAVIVFCLSYFI